MAPFDTLNNDAVAPDPSFTAQPSAGWGWILLFVLLPWSTELTIGKWSIEMPSEPLMAVLGMVLFIRLLKMPDAPWPWARNRLLPGFIWMLWLLVCVVFSAMPLVSLKYWVVEAGHWWVFAIAIAAFPHGWRLLVKAMIVSMAGVIIYTLFQHGWWYHFRPDQAILAPMPFFPDHTSYAAVLALLAPWVVVFSWEKKWVRYALTALWGSALLLSSCRAAWVSVGVSACIGAGWYYREKWRYLAFAAALVALAAGVQYNNIQVVIKEKISWDVSTQERFNRYDCAWRMVRERPLLGFGPGVYALQYFRFQQPANLTRISVQAPVDSRNPTTYGRGGGAHSEYWQAAAETGWLGLVLMVLLVFSAVIPAFFRLRQIPPQHQVVVLAALLSLAGFWCHALVNNLLHDGRVAALVWGQIGLLLNDDYSSATPA